MLLLKSTLVFNMAVIVGALIAIIFDWNIEIAEPVLAANLVLLVILTVIYGLKGGK